MFEIKELYDSGSSTIVAYVEAETKAEAYKKAGVLYPSGYTPITELSEEEAKQIKIEYFKKYSVVKLELKALKNYKIVEKSKLLKDLIKQKKNLLKEYKKYYCFEIKDFSCSQI